MASGLRALRKIDVRCWAQEDPTFELHREHSQSALAWYSANGVGHDFQHHFPLIFTFMYDFAINIGRAFHLSMYTLTGRK